ncbi:CRISPR-associated endoribonuclease Cas6 [Staphylococcus auricularis]|uniref:CRISPR-associated endoribonuclease Cas6 n=1 Tax=Staphylococcus auricularis TaxID=29379 RepID=UPI001932C24F|nr:CRISPR-associated endoribonuclease Cas6 [Staphylococcus auricularis]MBM0868302.1 CRISPR-associated endoribonuclease Cas6 [Staphylococcus auricularis]
MINKITVELSLPENIKPNYLGSVLHGVLMEYLSEEMADQLHHNYAYSPLKQRIYYENNMVVWEIVSMVEALSKELIQLFSTQDKIVLRHYQTEIELSTFKVKKYNIQDMMNAFLGTEGLDRFIRLKVHTPMSFKVNKRYTIFPEIKHFFRSIMIQFDAFFEDYRMYDNETLEFLASHVNIVDYKLKSTRFHLEKVKISSYVGEITLKIQGPLPFLQLVNFLLKFGELSGSGIKTSLGMGKYSIIEKDK